MIINILTAFPDFFKIPFEQGVLSQALKKNIIQTHLLNLRDFTEDKHQSIDDRPFGGGEGMVLSYLPLEKSLSSLSQKGKVIYLSPQGKKWNHQKAKSYSREKALTFICGRYSGLDSRFIHRYVDEEVSIGDYVVTGGELPALIVIDSICRFIEGVLGHKDSALEDTFENNFLLKSAQWTRPKNIHSYKIPEVFFSGNHEEIKKIRLYISLLRTKKLRPDLFEKCLYKNQLNLAQKWRQTLTLEEKKSCQIEED